MHTGLVAFELNVWKGNYTHNEGLTSGGVLYVENIN